jgi:hypothetical protein
MTANRTSDIRGDLEWNTEVCAMDVRTDWQTRVLAALLVLGIVSAHISDQGGITQFTDPQWVGWGYRLIEVGGTLTAIVLLPLGRWRPVWAAAVLLGAGPLLAYLASRTVGLPGDTGDIGNWGDWVGTMAILFESALILTALGVLLRRAPERDRAPAVAATR